MLTTTPTATVDYEFSDEAAEPTPEVHDGAFHQEGEAWVFEVAPRRAFGFSKGAPFGQTTWRFPKTLGL